MERLTEHYGDRYIRIKGCTSFYPREERKSAPASNAVVRLAAYEDTGLTPEEIERILDAYGRRMTLRTESGQRLEIIRDIPTGRLRELVKAEKEQRWINTAVAPVVHARWIKKHDDVCYWYECSECGRKPPHSEFYQEDHSRYCPNCGARMDLPEGEETT